MSGQWTDEELELMRKHTPGGWALHGRQVVAPDMPRKVFGDNGEYSHSYSVAQPHLYTQVEPNSEELAANCVLIAAAPELLTEYMRLRDENERLRQQLAEAQGWAPLKQHESVHDGFSNITLRMHAAGDFVSIEDSKSRFWAHLPPDIRICRRVEPESRFLLQRPMARVTAMLQDGLDLAKVVDRLGRDRIR